MIKKFLKKKFYSDDLKLIHDKTERFIVLTNDVRQKLGKWYSILALRILPILLFTIPIIVIMSGVSRFVTLRGLFNFQWDGTVLVGLCGAAMAVFLVFLILAPKLATVFELVFGFTYLFYVFKNHLFNTALGISLLVCMTLFLIVKCFFVVVAIIAKVRFSRDGASIERDESGRIVRKAGEDVFFVSEAEGKIIDENRPSKTVDSDFFMDKIEEAPPTGDKVLYDDDFFMEKIEDVYEHNSKSAARKEFDDDFFFGEKGKKKDEKNIPLAGSNDDYFFG